MYCYKIDEETVLSKWSEAHDISGIFNIYIDVPYCYKICNYCVHKGDRANIGSDILDKYAENVTNQIRRFKPVMSRVPDSIYFGGGTPSMLSIKGMESIIESLGFFNELKYSNIEINPMTLTKEKLKYLSGLKFGYVSLGVQTFNRDDLKSCNRDFSYEKLKETVEAFQSEGSSINIDLMQHITRIDNGENLVNDLVESMKLNPEFITVYGTYDKYKWPDHTTDANIKYDYDLKKEIEFCFDIADSDTGGKYLIEKLNLVLPRDDTLIRRADFKPTTKVYSCSNPPIHPANQSVISFGSVPSRKAFGYIEKSNFIYNTWIENGVNCYERMED